ncbi:MAG: 4Fe-4S dicluster domain-containing protein [Bacteroidales bacterium]
MEAFLTFSIESWNKQLAKLIPEYDIYAPKKFEENIEYAPITQPSEIDRIIYNQPKPSTPLKTFFLPVKENVVKFKDSGKKRIILGIPACDLHGLSLLDEIYMDEEYLDPIYSRHRLNTILIGSDCFSFQEHCHCTSYGFNPWPEKNEDLIVSVIGNEVILEVNSEKGKEFTEKWLKPENSTNLKSSIDQIKKQRETIVSDIRANNQSLPDYEQTGRLVNGSEEEIWNKYSDSCVSCGACSAICPTCSCFLFIERPEFEKVRSLDTCQYPGFERVAAGEDPLRQLSKRFRNRYMCKYVWKPEKFKSKACTGCGRCIEACIGEINKNELFIELNQQEHLSYDHNSR